MAHPGGRCAPVVVVLSRGAGHLRRPLCDDLAAQGFIALAPARDGRAAADPERSLDDVTRLLQQARDIPGAADKVGLLAFGRDALLALRVASRQACEATVVYGGRPAHRLVPESLGLRGPLLLHLPLAHAGEGAGPKGADLAALEGHPHIELHLYGGADGVAAAALARGRSLRFLRHRLGA